MASGSNIKSVCDSLVSLTDDIGLSQLQREPTREGNILDLYCTNNPGLVKGMNTIPGISDDDMIVVDSVIKPVTQFKKPRKVNQFSKADWEAAKNDTII